MNDANILVKLVKEKIQFKKRKTNFKLCLKTGSGYYIGNT